MMIELFRRESPAHVLEVADQIWACRQLFICWPKRALLFMPGTTRVRYHQYTDEQMWTLHEAGINPDTRSNGPAIMAYLLAGGKRPERVSPGRKWSIHHIYDGKFPWPERASTTHSVRDGLCFTEAAGLVAVHPIADALADEVPYFAWLLRQEAFERFGFDPDIIFSCR